MRLVLLVCLLAGCQQIFGLDHPIATDARVDTFVTYTDAVIDGPTLASCANDTNLVMCFDFEGNVNDLAPSPNATTASNVTFVAGKVGMAATFSSASRMTVSDSVMLDVGAVSIEAWVYPTALPSQSARAGILDVDAQYGMFVGPGGVLVCTGGGMLQSTTTIPLGAWSHVACTSGNGVAMVYIDGSPAGSLVPSGAIPSTGTTGAEIGGNNPDGADRFIGSIDLLRVFRVVRSQQQICTDAGCGP